MELPSVWRGVSVPGTYSGYVGGLSSAIDLPANDTQYVSIDSCYRLLGVGLGSSAIEYDTLLFPNITGLSRNTSYRIKFKLASIGYNPSVNGAAGVDLTDTIKLEFSPNNGLSWWREVLITGNGNATWGFNGAGQTVNKTSVFPSTTIGYYTSSSFNPIREVNLTLPTGYITQLRIRITMQLNGIGESFLVDDVQVLALYTLPIELTSFTGHRVGNRVKLKWSTQSETNNDYFSIYRSPHGLEYWELVGNISGAGNSSNTNNYTFIDASPINGLNYYVLMQTDYDGKREQFPPIVIMFVSPPIESIWDKYNFLGQEIK